MKKEVLNYYLYVSWNNKKQIEEFLSYMLVAKTMVKEEMSDEMQILSDNVFIFSSKFNFNEIKNKLKHKRFPYVLIDMTVNMSFDLLSMYLQENEIEILNKFIDKSNQNQISYFNIKLEECLGNEDFETACFYRDLIKNKTIVANGQDIE
jgi:hypothetical protein